ncbi:MAG: electron transport complex subunit RsxC [Pseudomonadota bacterium]
MATDNPRLWRFPGGLELPGHKASAEREVREAPLPPELILPLQQHIGDPAEPVVEVGQHVLAGELIARCSEYLGVPVHASTSGTVTAIEERPVAHPSGLRAPCIVIAADGEDTWAEPTPLPDYPSIEPDRLRQHIRKAGIVGLGGAGFPSAVKLNSGGRAVETLILNGAECEPYITCDDRLMRDDAEAILRGLLVMRHALSARHCIIAVEDNKPAAITALKSERARLAHERPEVVEVNIVAVPTRYPAGGEKQLIHTLTGREVPSNGLPVHIGVICHNVGTAAAIHRAVNEGRPLVERLVTITGSAIPDPGVWRVRLGSPIGTLVESRVERREAIGEVIVGGPMMGFRLFHHEAPVVKTNNCLLVPAADEVRRSPEPMPCIRCGACVDVCPARLLPQQLYWYARDKDLDKAQAFNLFDCIECGCCAYVCPSNLPLVQYYRFAKTEIANEERERRKADIARERHEFRQERLEREKAERAARQARKKKAVAEESGDGGGQGDDKKAAIQAAVERAKQKKAQQADEQPTGDAGDNDRQDS